LTPPAVSLRSPDPPSPAEQHLASERPYLAARPRTVSRPSFGIVPKGRCRKHYNLSDFAGLPEQNHRYIK